MYGGSHLLCHTHRHCTLGHHHGIVVEVLANGLSHLKHILQVGRPVFIGRSAHCREDYLLVVEHICQRRGELQSAGFDVLQHQFVETRLIDGYFSAHEALYLLFVNVNTCNVGTCIGKACARHQAHIACSYYCNIHILLFFIQKRRHRQATQPSGLSRLSPPYFCLWARRYLWFRRPIVWKPHVGERIHCQPCM